MKGSRVGPYLLLAEIGTGGMGTVYLSHDEEEDRAVAVKVLHPQLSERSGFFRRFQREAYAGMRVRHPHVVRTLDFGLHVEESTTCCYLVTEFVEGRTLRALLRELGTVPEALVREIARQVASGLSAIHAAGVVHRDIKPDNVLITGDDQVRIMDLGVAKVLDATQELTREGQFAGSLAYAAPEQFRDGPVGPAADLYSLGVLLHELVAGRNPLARETSAGTVRAQLEEVPPDLEELAPDVSPLLAEIVGTLLQKRVESRMAGADAILSVLAAGERSEWWEERREERRRRRSAIPRVPVRRETVLHGREDDLALLADRWAKAKAGEGSTLLVEGEAGIGKSRLVDAFLSTLSAHDAQALYGSYSPSGGLGALADALLLRFGRERLESSMAPLLSATPALVPAFAARLRGEPVPGAAGPLPGDALQGVFVRLLRGLAEEKPLVWVVEDLHFASQDSRRIVLSLARAVEGHRALLLLTSRPPVPEGEIAALQAAGPFGRMRPGRLGAQDVVALLREAFRNEHLAEKLGPRLAEKSDGVPFFVFEAIQGLRAGKFVTERPDGSWTETRVIDRIEVPSAVRELIAARLAGVPAPLREVLDVGAVEGYGFDPGLAAAVLGRRPLAVLQALSRLERRSGVVRAAGRRYRFDHHQIQEVLYSELSPRLREEYHAAIASVLEREAGAAGKEPAGLDGALCVDLARHFLEGARGGRALRYLDPALTHLEQAYRNDAAVRLAGLALAAPSLITGARRADLLLRQAACLDLQGRREEERAAIDEALAIADPTDDFVLRARIHRALGLHLTRVCAHVRAEAELKLALDLSVKASDRPGEASATGSLGIVCYSLGRLAEARERHERHLALARELGDRHGEATATGNLGTVAQAAGQLVEAVEHQKRYLALSREIGDRRAEGAAAGNLGLAYHALGRFAEAREHHELNLAVARETGNRRGEGLATGNLGMVFWALGRHAEASELYEKYLAIAQEVGDRRGEAIATGNLGLVLYSTGLLAEARDRCERFLAISREIGDRQSEASARSLLGNVAEALGELAAAREHCESYLALAREIGSRRGEALAAAQLGNLEQALGRLAGARGHFEHRLAHAKESGDRKGESFASVNLGQVCYLLGLLPAARAHHERSLALAREIGDPRARCFAIHGLADVAAEEGDSTEAERLLTEALEVRRSMGDRFGEAQTLGSRGALRARRGRAEEARDDLDRSVALARELSFPEVELWATCVLATLPGGELAPALASLEKHAARVGPLSEMPARMELFRATGDPAHLAAAKRLLDLMVEHAPADCRESMLGNVRLHREIAAEAAERRAGPGVG